MSGGFTSIPMSCLKKPMSIALSHCRHSKRQFLMASLRKRGGNWRVQVRLAGSSPITKSVPFKKDAVHWAKVQESKFRLGEYAPPDERSINSTVGEMLVRYSKDDVCKKRSANYERIKIGALLRTELAQIRLSEITARPFVRYRNARLLLARPPEVCAGAVDPEAYL